jgi:hypothetical protein
MHRNAGPAELRNPVTEGDDLARKGPLDILALVENAHDLNDGTAVAE